jgi:LCP family protein required for cell wall assembly
MIATIQRCMPDPIDPSEPPRYRKYRARPSLFPRRPKEGGTGLDELRREGAGDAPGGGRDPHAGAPDYAVHGRARGRRPSLLRRRRGVPRGPMSFRRVVKWLVLALVAWLGISVVAFLVSAQIQESKADSATQQALRGSGQMPFTTNTILVLGSDARTKGTHEAGAQIGGPSRSDSIMLMRVGGGHNGRLSIARDTIVNIPGHGLSKINAAYAYGGAPLAIQTIEQWLGIPINHVVQVNFDNFPNLIDAMGGIDYHGGCVVSRINGGYKNGGITLRLKSGTTHIDGKQALALARTRKNACNLRESDLTRAHRQQKLLSSMKDRLTSPGAFIRLPWISWDAPKAIDSDMAGPSLMGLFGALATGGTPKMQVLGTLSGQVSDAQKQAAVQRFLRS